MPDLLLLRHGQSQWNLENRFTGWVDVPLSPRGEAEARAAGEKLRGRKIDKLYTSVLVRATETARLALEAAGIGPLPTERDAALNERMYGDLQGKNKAEAAERFGAAQVKLWRRSYDVRPPAARAWPTPRHACCPTGRATSCPTCAPARTCWWWHTGTRCAPSSCTWTGSRASRCWSSRSRPACRCSTSWRTTGRCAGSATREHAAARPAHHRDRRCERHRRRDGPRLRA